jgi:hypothetical protein
VRGSNPYDSVPVDRRLEYSVIAEELKRLYETVTNLIEREWSIQVEGSREVLLLLTKVAVTTYQTTVYFCAEKPEDPFRKIEFAASAPPLLRSLLDEVCTAVFLGTNLPEKVPGFIVLAGEKLRSITSVIEKGTRQMLRFAPTSRIRFTLNGSEMDTIGCRSFRMDIA